MKVALTGSTGFIGSHILSDLGEHGHEVIGLVRDSPDTVTARGGTPAVVDLYDRPAVVRLLSDADAAIHTASPGDETSANLDGAVADAAIKAFEGTGKPYLHISGLWVYGDNTSISEESPMQSPALVAWREPIERRILDATGMRGVVIVSGIANGDGGGGLPGLLLGSPRDDVGNLIMLGTGVQHWPTVHVADLANLFRRVLEDDSARGYYIAADGRNPTVAELTNAAAVAVGAPAAVPGSDEEARARLGDYFAEVVLLDQATVATKARDELGWQPTHPGLVDELREGSYRDSQRDRLEPRPEKTPLHAIAFTSERRLLCLTLRTRSPVQRPSRPRLGNTATLWSAVC
jgi:nucleoside-diphosphate-sugar epimerase